MARNNIDLIVDKILKDKLTPAQINSLALVINSLKGQTTVTPSPNKVKDDTNSSELTEDFPMDFDGVKTVEIAGVKGSKRKIKIYKNPEV